MLQIDDVNLICISAVAEKQQVLAKKRAKKNPVLRGESTGVRKGLDNETLNHRQLYLQ
jgi:hypothetical protein